MTNEEQRIYRLEGENKQLAEKLRQLWDAVAALKQNQFTQQGGGGGGDGGAGAGIFNATPAGSIAAGNTSNETVVQSWDGTSVGTKIIRNTYANTATIASRKLTLGQES